MSVNPRPPIANMFNLMVQLGAAVPNTVISGSAYGNTTVTARLTPRPAAKKASKRR